MNRFKESSAFCTSYCNRAHDLNDGKPIDHNCFILNKKALRMEFLGNVPGAIEIGIVKEPRVEMKRGKRPAN